MKTFDSLIKKLTTSIKPAVFILMGFIFSQTAVAQNCGCTLTIGLTQEYVDAKSLNLAPGSTICIQAGNRRFLRLVNFKGTKEQPLIIKNCGGQVRIQNTDQYFGLRIDNSQYFKLTGTGDSNHKFGIYVGGTGNNGNAIMVGEFSSDAEIEFVEVAGAGFAGIMAKTDPRCDGSSNRGNFFMRNLSIHDTFIHDVKGEGLYIGNSFYAGKSTSCGGKTVTLYPHDIIGLRVYNNIIKNTGWDGIQVGSASEDVEIYNNVVENYGIARAIYHTNGIQIGEGTTGRLYNNKIITGTGNGIIMLGLGNNIVYNNLIVNPGDMGVFSDDRFTKSGSEIAFINNNIINPRNEGIKIFNKVTTNRAFNNIILNPGKAYVDKNNASNWTEANNIYTKDANPLAFTNAGAHDYSLRQGSSAIDAGKDVSSYGISKDFANAARPQGKTYDIGAYEFASTTLETTATTTTTTTTTTTQPTNSLVKASTFQDPNTPQNTLDGDLNTRWSAEGVGEWIRYDLESEKTVPSVEIAFLNGNTRRSFFEIQVSNDDVNYTTLLNTQSSGTSTSFEKFTLPNPKTRYVRILGKGNSQNLWNSYIEVKVNTDTTTTAPTTTTTATTTTTTTSNLVVKASTFQDPNTPLNTLDGDINTRWSAEGVGEWIRYDLASERIVTWVEIAFFNGNSRKSFFEIQVSQDDVNYTTILNTQSSGTSTGFERFPLPNPTARFVRILGKGNSTNLWNSYNEVKINHASVVTNPVVVADIANQSVVENNSLALQVKTTGGEKVVLSATGLPSFGTITDNGDGTATLSFRPVLGHAGIYQISVKATEANGTSSTKSFTLTVNFVQPIVRTTTASSQQGSFGPHLTLDKNFGTRWSANGIGQWINYDLGVIRSLNEIQIAFHNGNSRSFFFDVEISSDNRTWQRVASHKSAGNTLQLEPFAFNLAQGRYIRIVNKGNSKNTWADYTEVEIHPVLAKGSLGTSARKEQPLAIELKETKQEFIIYPNPFKNSLNIKIGDQTMDSELHISLFDHTGRNVINTTQAIHGEQIRIDLASFGLQPGFYFLKIKGEHTAEQSFKLIKK